MNDRRTVTAIGWLGLGVVALLGWLWLHRWLAARLAGGEAFYAIWLGLRGFLLQGESPYLLSPAFVRAQAPAWVSISGGLAPLVPPPALWLWLPWAWVPDPLWALALWWVTLEAALVLALGVAFFVLRQPLAWGWAAALVLFSLTWPPLVLAFWQGDAAPLALAALGLALALLTRRRDAAAGALLTLALVQPERTWLAVLLVWVWALARRRWAVLGAAWATLAAGALITAWLLPGGWWDYFAALGRAVARSDLVLPFQALHAALPGLGGRLARPVLAILGLIALREAVALAFGQHLMHLAWGVGLGLTLAPWFGLPWAGPDLALWLFPWWVAWALWVRAWRYTPPLWFGLSALVSLGGWLAWARAGWPTAWGVGVTLLPGALLLLALYGMRWRATRAAWLDATPAPWTG